MSKLRNIIDIIQYGGAVADPANWKKRQISATVIGGLIWAVLGITGYDEQIGGETVDAVAVGLLALVNGVLTIATSKKVGLRDKRKHNRGQES